ncbi:hypothetical protein M9H77_27257 [Catharanthus roseus]|uniref:Uncharacterized protein n=1 Tax=Catharanthus roseus TaxID=4058 RepID=A0ACC0ACE1_CATRO|nr:hypothetical protein M9H77_27257 [Catharanthus roseus]
MRLPRFIGIPIKRGKFLIGSTLPTKKSFLVVEKLFKVHKLLSLSVVGPKGKTLLLTCYIPASLHGSFFEPCFSLPPLRVQNRPIKYSQVVRHRFLIPACKGSNPFTPDYEHPIPLTPVPFPFTPCYLCFVCHLDDLLKSDFLPCLLLAAEESDPSPILLGKAVELMAGLAGTLC